MSTINARTKIKTKEGFLYPCKFSFEINNKGRIRNSVLYSGPMSLRPFMILDLLAETMPNWLYIGDVTVTFGYTYVEHPVLAKMRQPCLIVSNEYGETRYLINRYCDVKWMETVYRRNLAAMVVWWRENRDMFLKPVQKWEWNKTDSKSE